MPDDQSGTTAPLKRGDTVRTRPDVGRPRRGVFLRYGQNGLAQVQWNGNASVTYLAEAQIEKVEEPANAG